MLSHKPPSLANLKRFNVLIIITDQQRHDAVGYVNPKVITPNIDALAKRSTIFTHAFVQSPQCQPSRASIWTGRYPTAHKVWWNETPLSKSERTIGNAFRDAGYKTGYFGKFHVENDVSAKELARHFGFTNTYLMEDWSQFITKDTIDGKSSIVRREFFGAMSNKTWTGTITNRTLHHEDVITKHAIKFLSETTKPYLAIVSYHGPHPPYAAPAEYSQLYDKSEIPAPLVKLGNLLGHTLSDEEWKELKAQYYGSVSWIDDNIGELLAKVGDDTIIVFMSDHGDMLGDHGHFSKGIYAYDGNTRIPLLIHHPLKPALTYTRLTQAIDVLPTLCRFTNVPITSGVQGHSLDNHLINNSVCNREIVSMLCHTDRLRMIRTEEWKYWIHGKNEYLFDIINDPDETNNLASKPECERMLNHARFRLMTKLIECEDPLPLPHQPNR